MFVNPAHPDAPGHPAVASTGHRERLLAAMAQAVASRGLANTTVADVVTLARVSRRTFYEHFASREDCFLALYEAISAQALRVLAAAIEPGRDWRPQIGEALQRYLALLASQPMLLRAMFVAVFELGDAGLAARRRVHESLADYIESVFRASAGSQDSPPQRELVTGLVGGIHELVLQALEDGRAEQLTALVPSVTRLITRVLGEPV
jgi:AcrR family transcriptional regulator